MVATLELDDIQGLVARGYGTLRAATFNAARSAALEGEIGSIQPGRRADLLLVPGNPLLDLRALDNVRAVYKHGLPEVEHGRLLRS